MHWNSFNRARRFARPSLATSLAVYGSSLVAAVAVVLLILALGAITDLASSRGNLTIPLEAKAEVQQLAGSPDRSSGDQLQYVGRGLLPAVWRLHGTWLGQTADRLYTEWNALEHNDTCLLAIVVIGWCLSFVLAAALYTLERSARIAARNAVRRLRRALYQQSVQLGPGDLLTHFGQLFFRCVGLFQLPLLGEQVLQPLLQEPHFLFDAEAICILPTFLGLRLQPVSGLQQFHRFLFHFFSHRLGPLPKLIGFGSDENPTAAEQ